MYSKEDHTKFGNLIFEDHSMRIYYNPEREMITTLEQGKSTHPHAHQTPSFSTSFGSTEHIHFSERDDLEIETRKITHKAVLIAMIKILGINDFDIRPVVVSVAGKFYDRHVIKFNNEADYSFFKLKYFKNFGWFGGTRL
jgi:hypothetical protein